MRPKLLIIELWGLGDLVIATPFIQAAAEKYELTLLAKSYARDLKPSARGELEITDVNNAYIEAGDLEYDVLDGWWTDAGNIESLHLASRLVATKRGENHAARNVV